MSACERRWVRAGPHLVTRLAPSRLSTTVSAHRHRLGSYAHPGDIRAPAPRAVAAGRRLDDAVTAPLSVPGPSRDPEPPPRAWPRFPRRASANASTDATNNASTDAASNATANAAPTASTRSHLRPAGAFARRSHLGSRAMIGLALALGIVAACTSGPAGSSGSPATTAPAGSSMPSATVTAPATAAAPASPSTTATSTPVPTPTPSPAPPLALASSAFSNGGAIPTRYTCSDADVSPPLGWSHAPQGTLAFALVVVDTDASGFVHWVISDIPGDRTSLAAGQRVGVAGRNSFGGVGYGGPCPPVGSGSHHYVFTLYALSHRLGLGGVPTAAQVRAAAAKVTLATAHITGTFRR